MKAAVLEKLGEVPKFKDFEEPKAEGENEIILNVKAAAVKNLDKARASGEHYDSYSDLPTVVGMDGVGTTEDGSRVYATGITGMIAEKAVVDKNKLTPIPDDLDFDTAAALPNAVLGGVMPIKVRGKLEKGQNVLIIGATGFTGNIAVQVAKHYGAKTIVAAGRAKDNLEDTKNLGADITVNSDQDDEGFIKDLQKVYEDHPIDLIIDYLWGKPMELVLKSLKGGGLGKSTKKVRIVSVGSLAGETISLPSGTLRSTDIEIIGSGFGSLSPDDLDYFGQTIVPEMYELAAKGTLHIDTQVEAIEDIESLWNKKIESGKRLVISLEK
ncbi:zinc-binding dehydrogenase [Flavobacteriaceae bacterium Ap0902]|nr:zinc-binding dehydrogenase [Flavobacteriaceae bacterium Ap0902]